MSNSQFLRGTFILTAATFISKFLGMIYVFPFYALIGEEGAALYTYAYLPYSVLISVATMGVPLAVSKFVSKYNTLEDYETGREMFKSGLLLMAMTGVIACIMLFWLAPLLSPLILGDNGVGNTTGDVTYVIRMVSIALIIVPVMSLIRGFFQGYHHMEPTAISQVIEQIIRIIFILLGSFVVLKILDGDIKTAVGLSTFAAFVGAIGGLVVLGWFWTKKRDHLNALLLKSKRKVKLSKKEMYKELLTYAGPFVFVGLAIPLYQLIDQFTFNRAMTSVGKGAIAEVAFSTLNFSSHKLVMIPVSLATAFALSLIPTITKSFTDQNYSLLNKQIVQTLQVILLLTLPAVIGLSILSYPAYATFFDVESAEKIGGFILKWYAPVALFFALFTVTSAILQGMNLQRFAVISLFSGLMLKLFLNVFLIKLFEASGSIAATYIGFICSVCINLYIIKKHANLSLTLLYKRSLLIIIFVFLMSIIVLLIKSAMSLGLSYEDGRFQAITILVVSVAGGASFYLWLTYRTNLAGKVLGDKFSISRRKLKKRVQSID